MGRWQPDAAGRLQRAAMDLFGERGYDATTVVQIAERAELAERTFFRYFADKREVLFAGGPQLQQALLDGLAGVSASAPPLDQAAAALSAAGDVFADRDHSRRRQAIIDGNTELQERELIKLAQLGTTLTDALRQRGAEAATARLSAEAGMAVFKVTFECWIAPGEARPFAELLAEAMAELREVVTAVPRPFPWNRSSRRLDPIR